MDGTRLPVVPAALRERSPDVYYVDEPLVVVGDEELAFLRRHAALSPRRRARICTHPDPSAGVHEMLIIHHRTAYVRPHRHREKSESLHVLEGEALVAFFDDRGALQSSIQLGERGSRKPFYYRVPANQWHALAIRTEWFVFHEVVAGPFEREQTEFPSWAPDGSDPTTADAFRLSVLERASR